MPFRSRAIIVVVVVCVIPIWLRLYSLNWTGGQDDASIEEKMYDINGQIDDYSYKKKMGELINQQMGPHKPDAEEEEEGNPPFRTTLNHNHVALSKNVTIGSQSQLHVATVAEKLHTSKNERFVIVAHGDKDLFEPDGKYHNNWKSIQQYGEKQGYKTFQVDRNQVSECAKNPRIFWYIRQCTHSKLLEHYFTHDLFDWVVMVDGDSAVINDEKRLEEYIPADNHAHMIFYLRNHFEVMAGNVMMKVSKEAVDFSKRWADMIKQGRDDNVFLQAVLEETLDLPHCKRYFGSTGVDHGFDKYFGVYLRCFNCQLLKKYNGNLKDMNGLVTIHRRDHGFATDIHSSWTSAHLIYHGYKSSEGLSESKAHNVSKKEFFAQLPTMKWRLSPYGDLVTPSNRDISRCWPNCTPNYDNGTMNTLVDDFKCSDFHNQTFIDINTIQTIQDGVNCGGHFALICAECPQENGAAWCNGDCTWSSTEKVCRKVRTDEKGRGHGSTSRRQESNFSNIEMNAQLK